MVKGLMGKKLGMVGYFTPDGQHIPVTVIEAGPCVVTQIKTVAKEGYNALQLGFGNKKEARISNPLKGHFKKSGGGNFAFTREFPAENPEEYALGQMISLDIFEVGERVDIVGYTKGRGFSGVIKRHGFHRGPMTHGSKNIRRPGSIGCSAWPARVTKGKKMPGRYGNERKTSLNLKIVDIRPEENLLFVRGAIPGFKTGLVAIKKKKTAQ
jgi:large subunit ribosomal protein L3